jgi:hypothetical protein
VGESGRVNLERLETFVATLTAGCRHVLEMREPSWYAPEVLALPERRNDQGGHAPRDAITLRDLLHRAL